MATYFGKVSHRPRPNTPGRPADRPTCRSAPGEPMAARWAGMRRSADAGRKSESESQRVESLCYKFEVAGWRKCCAGPGMKAVSFTGRIMYIHIWIANNAAPAIGTPGQLFPRDGRRIPCVPRIITPKRFSFTDLQQVCFRTSGSNSVQERPGEVLPAGVSRRQSVPEKE